MTLLLAVVTQEPAFVGWVAALAVVIFVAVSLVVLVVVGGGEVQPFGLFGEDREEEPPVPMEVPRAAPPIAVADSAETTFAASLTTAMRGIALAVVQRAAIQPGERILDGGTGGVVAPSPGLLSGLRVLPVDAASATLAIGRRVQRGARVAGADFVTLDFAPGWFNAVIAVHTLQFAADPAGVLREWRRVTGPGGRLSISVPGPRTALGMRLFDPIYRRHEAGLQVHLPTRRALAEWATSAGWREATVFDDPGIVIRLPDPEALRTWMETRPWSDPDHALSPGQLDALASDLLAAMPRGPAGSVEIPFGALYLTARNS